MSLKPIECKPILAIDAGFVNCGWAIICGGAIVATGCIRTEKSGRKQAVRVADDDAARCASIARGLVAVIAAHGVKGVVAELPSAGAKGARAIACMARAGAVLATLVELLHLPAEWVTPGAVKQVAGAKNASKEAVEAAVLRRWPAAPLPELKAEREHVADALGAYLAAEQGTLVRLLNGTASSVEDSKANVGALGR